jgi:peptidoglycan/LPS O-acetylase OafA/YrhL
MRIPLAAPAVPSGSRERDSPEPLSEPMMPEDQKTTARDGKIPRISALDFTKGALVLIMVLYHWLNYFVVPGGDVFRYLRFLTPSFICISGFLISSVYLSKYDISDPRIPKRLAERGLKILGIFMFLNLIISLLFRSSPHGKILFASLSIQELVSIFVTGNTMVAGVGKAAAFYILVPISYLLLFSAGLMIVSRFYKFTFQTVFLCCLLSILILDWNGLQSENLELLTIGFLGVIIGHFPFEKINRFVRHPYLLVVAYLCYLAAITLWDVIYPLQIVGVCLSLAIIYLIGASRNELGETRKQIVLLGKYSLLGYIAQILILQFLRRGFRLVDLRPSTLAISFVAALALTIISVAAVDRLRSKSAFIDGLYRAVFS